LTRGKDNDGGTPQGGVISPLLANICLHDVVDRWVVEWRRVHADGDVIIVRYADDFVPGFQHRDEAERVPEAVTGADGGMRAGTALGEKAPD
jgi:RNA-directed DNA polymerase